ncbi:MAG: AraC family transcriptional regulator [Ruminococcus sp.]|jgi:AraC-like DNA-binding protein|nr:AraC family transcriptional regulator [Ruminococcus sp.]
MIIHNVGYNHCHDADFLIDRPDGSGDYLLLVLKTDTIFTLDGKDTIVPKNSFFLYKKGTPQYYRCLPMNTFSNDWVHFLFDDNEEMEFLSLGLQYNVPVTLDNILFLSFCIKSIASETYSNNKNRQSSIKNYMMLIFNKVSEKMAQTNPMSFDNSYEMLSTIRNKIYSHPFEQRNVDQTAHEIRMSKSNFQHLYKKYFNVSFTNDLINSRIEYAKMLLSNTNLSIIDISKQCGYNHYAHFERQFKSLTEYSPLEYKKITVASQ